MADIDIQRKSSSAVWWILGIIIVALILFLLFAWGGADRTTMDPAATPISDAAALEVTLVA